MLFRWPDILDLFPMPSKEPAKSYNAISRLVLFGGLTMFYVRRNPAFLTGTALIMLYLFGEQDKYIESYYMTRKDMKLEEDMAPPPDPNKDTLTNEAKVAAQRMTSNPRDIQARPAIVPTADDKIYAARPLPTGGWDETRFPDWMAGNVGLFKSVVKPN